MNSKKQRQIHNHIKTWKEALESRKKPALVFVVFAGLAVSAAVGSRLGPVIPEGQVERQQEGRDSENRTFSYQIDGTNEQELTLDIAPVQRGQKAAMDLLSKAVDEWEACYLGENRSVNEVRTDLKVPDGLCDGLVRVSMESSDYSVLDTDGHIHTESLDDDGALIELTVTFSYSDYSRMEIYGLHVLGPEEGSAEWLRMQLQKEAQQTEETSREEDRFLLPESVNGHAVHWKTKPDHRWLYLLFLGAVAAFCLEWKDRENARKKQMARRKQLMYEYPLMVDQLSILLDSGMTVRRAWELMLNPVSKQGRKEEKDPLVYITEMKITWREIKEGRGEREAYERFGNRIGLMPYRRLGSMLSQNLSKGTENIKALLQKESQEAFDMRKNRARKEGEEAGTKMLFPMLIMLLLLLLVLLFPAAASFV